MSTAAVATTFLSKLSTREDVAEGTMAFRFEKPEGWTFIAGQYVDMTLLNPPETDKEGNTRTFSIASAPQDDLFMVATRMRDTAFKRVLQRLPIGTAVKIEGPSGTLTLHDDTTRAAVLLAGGIGITPFRSMLRCATKEKRPHRLILFYSNRRPEDAPFLDELQALERDNPHYTLIATMTEMTQSRRAWSGETGLITKEKLATYARHAALPVYYIAGPPKMVKGLRTMLREIGIENEDIRAEEFAGY